ncbi:MAG: PEP-CTERM sorting domain-containing protein [Gemmatirosa sp.]|nr:PEP-CTERM sorting domain-containing protein [Gemmatirosa sp.]
MKGRGIATLVLAASLGAPAVASAGIVVNPCPVNIGSIPGYSLASPISITALPTVLVCANGKPYALSNIIVRGKLAILPTTVIDLGGGASFTVSADFNSDPFSSFTFGSIIPNGFGPVTFDAYFSTPVAPGSYNNASSSGTLGITTTGPNGSDGQVSAGTYPFYIEGLADATNLGVDTGSGTCDVLTPPSPNSGSCNPPGASNTFAPISPALLTAHLSYTHNTLVSGSSAVGWTGSVQLNASTVPEPATLGLVVAGVLMIGGVGYRRSRNG